MPTGQPPERKISDGDGVPCRHCLGYVEAGAPYLVLAYRPFPAPQPYAEVGPVFLHADPCPAYDPANGLPPRHRRATGSRSSAATGPMTASSTAPASSSRR